LGSVDDPMAPATAVEICPERIEILSPEGRVTESTVWVEVRVPDAAFDFDPSSDVTLNKVPLPLTGTGPLYTTRIGPGFPLRSGNVLQVRSRRSSGQPFVTARGFSYAPPKAHAFEIRKPKDLLTGPLAHNRVGDFMLENEVARFVVQAPAPLGPGGISDRDLYSVGQYGGNLIGAALQGRPGLENFLELQPSLNVESVVNAQTVEVVNDGEDGTAAIVRACGPDDLLDFANPSSFLLGTIFVFPPLADDRDLEIEACTEYRLEPDAAYLEIETTVFNNQPVGSDPEDLPLIVGDWLNAGGQLEAWTTPATGLGPGLLSPGGLGVLAWFGFGEALGVDYGYTTLPSAGLESTTSDFFYTSGVNVVIHHGSVLGALLGVPPPFVVTRGGSRSYTRTVSVGDGSGANTIAMETAVKGASAGSVEGCVRVGGAPAAEARVSLGTLGGPFGIDDVLSIFVTRPGECPNYSGAVPAGGPYGAAAARTGTLYEGGGPLPAVQNVLVSPGGTTTGVDFDLPAPGQLEVHVVDENEDPLPARITVVGFDPSPDLIRPGANIPGFGSTSHGLFDDPSDGRPFGLVRVEYADASGHAGFDLEPGSYQLFVSRGTEYSAFDSPIEIHASETTSVGAQIARVVDTSGFVSSDFHVHGIRSADSRVSDRDRVFAYSAEGVENPIMTDHHVHTDLRPMIAAMGMSDFLTSTVGEEVTTFDYGHFNAYPMLVDPDLPSGGSTDWAQPSPPGQEFPSYGNYNATPAGIFGLGTAGDHSIPGVSTMQINHIDSHFVALQIDTGAPGPITDGLDADDRLALRLDPASGNLFHHFPALELWNGDSSTDQGFFLEERIGVWFNHLSKGLPTTAIADTDTHSFTNLNSAGARTWTASPTGDEPAWIQSADVAHAVTAGRAVGGQGLYVQTRLLAQDGSGGVADLGHDGSTLVASQNGDVDLEISVQAPAWARFDRIEVYANAATEPVSASAPYLYRPAPGSAIVLEEGDCDPTSTNDGDFDIEVSNPSGLPGAERLAVSHKLSFSNLQADTWFVVVARGSESCPPMFPVYPDDLARGSNTTLEDLLDGNVGEAGVLSLGFTNALYADVDGTPGFQPVQP
jgi:hypothetical protein